MYQQQIMQQNKATRPAAHSKLLFIHTRILIMNAIKNSIKNFINDEAGVTAIEYALLAALIAVALFGVVATLTSKISAGFAAAGSAIKDVIVTRRSCDAK